jgi:hypothetical protein
VAVAAKVTLQLFARSEQLAIEIYPLFEFDVIDSESCAEHALGLNDIGGVHTHLTQHHRTTPGANRNADERYRVVDHVLEFDLAECDDGVQPPIMTDCDHDHFTVC